MPVHGQELLLDQDLTSLSDNVPGCRTLPAGIEYELKDAQEPHLFIICKQLRTSPSSVSSLRYYYILDGNVYQAPSMHVALASRLVSHSG